MGLEAEGLLDPIGLLTFASGGFTACLSYVPDGGAPPKISSLSSSWLPGTQGHNMKLFMA